MAATAFDYAHAPYPIRADIAEANRRAWRRLARPGSWWSGAERVAIAAEMRRAPTCTLCRARKDALSPNAVRGTHDSATGELPTAAIDAVHRITTDPMRLSEQYYQTLITNGMTDGHYVELVGVIVNAISVDAFHHALGLPLEPLPEPEPGKPSGYRPRGAAMERAWVPMIAPRRIAAQDKDIYAVPRVVNVLRALSLVPDEVRTLIDLSCAYYMPDLNVASARATGNRAISRPQMELVAARVSANNECFY